MSRSVWRTLVVVAGLVLVSGCGGDEIRNPGSDSGNDAPVETGDADVSADTSPDAETDGDVTSDVDAGPSFEELFVECEDNAECSGANDICFQQTCVRQPLVEAELWREESNDYVQVDGDPDLSCWVTPAPLGEGPETARISGNVELFGPAQPTRNLCVIAYNQALLVRWLAWLDANVCAAQFDVDPRRQEPYVNCFGLDPCRCDDEEYTVNRGTASDGEEACYAEIGYCAGIEDAELLATCRANILERTGTSAETLIYGHTVSVPYEPNPERTEGVYTIESVPTNTRLVIKVSGRPTLWRDTYEWGAVIAAPVVDEAGDARWDANVIGDGAWNTIPLTAGIPEPTPRENVAIAGIIRDCSDDNNQQVLGAQVGLVVNAVKVAYFNGVASDTLPSPGQAYTNSDGVYAAISAPAGPNRVSVAVQQHGEVVSAGVRDIFATPFSVIIATFEGNWE